MEPGYFPQRHFPQRHKSKRNAYRCDRLAVDDIMNALPVRKEVADFLNASEGFLLN